MHPLRQKLAIRRPAWVAEANICLVTDCISQSDICLESGDEVSSVRYFASAMILRTGVRWAPTSTPATLEAGAPRLIGSILCQTPAWHALLSAGQGRLCIRSGGES